MPGAAVMTAVPDPHPASSMPLVAILISRARVSGTGSLLRVTAVRRYRLSAVVITIGRASGDQQLP